MVGDRRAAARLHPDRDAAVIVGRGSVGATRCVAPTVTVRGRGSGSPSPLFCCACRVGGGVALPHPVTLRALIEAFLGNSDCATALLFPPGQMTSTGVAGLPGRRVGAQHRCAAVCPRPNDINRCCGVAGASRRGAASLRPYDIWSGGVFGGDAPRVGDAPRGGAASLRLRYGRVGFLGATHRGWATHRGGATGRGWATHRVGDAPRRPYDMVGWGFWGRGTAAPGRCAARGGVASQGATRRVGGGA